MSHNKQPPQLPDHSSATSELISIHDAAEHFKKNQLQALEDKCIGLSQALDHALKTLDQKDQEIQHLKQLLGNSVPVLGQLAVPFSDEEIIATKQLELIANEARIRPLTLDEIKKYDLLVKNKRLAQGNATTIEGKKSNVKELGKVDLLKLAASNTSSGEE